MKKKWGIPVVMILLGVSAAVAWMFVRPKDTVVIKGYLPPQDVAAIKSLVKKDMARRLLPDYSWASFKSLVPDIRAYFRYNILEINSWETSDTRVEVGDGATAASSKHVCEYLLRKDAKGWSVVVILSPNVTGPLRAAGAGFSLRIRTSPFRDHSPAVRFRGAQSGEARAILFRLQIPDYLFRRILRCRT